MRFNRVLSMGALLALAVTAQHAVACAPSTVALVAVNPSGSSKFGTSDGTATLKIAGDPDAAPIGGTRKGREAREKAKKGSRNYRATPGEGPVGRL